MTSRLAVATATACLLTGSAIADEAVVQRFTLYNGVRTGAEQPGISDDQAPVTMLLDTATGRTWKLEEKLYDVGRTSPVWRAIEYDQLGKETPLPPELSE